MDAAAELGRNPVSKHQIQPEYGDEQADDTTCMLCRSYDRAINATTEEEHQQQAKRKNSKRLLTLQLTVTTRRLVLCATRMTRINVIIL